MTKKRVLSLLTALLVLLSVPAMLETSVPSALPSAQEIIPMILSGSETAVQMARQFFKTAPFDQAYAALEEALKGIAGGEPSAQTPELTPEQLASLQALGQEAFNTLGSRAVETQGTTYNMFAQDGAFIGDGIPANGQDIPAEEKTALFLQLLGEKKALYTALHHDNVTPIEIRLSTDKAVLASAGFTMVEGLTINNIPVQLISRGNGTALISAETLLAVLDAQWLMMNNPGLMAPQLLVDNRTLLADGQAADPAKLAEAPKPRHDQLLGEKFLVYHPEDGYYRLVVVGVHAPIPEVVPVAAPAAAPEVTPAPPVETEPPAPVETEAPPPPVDTYIPVDILPAL